MASIDIPSRRRRTIYVASSWRNVYYNDVVNLLKQTDNDVYDFRNPAPGNKGFGWSQIDENWKNWTRADYLKALEHPVALAGFGYDLAALDNAEACVLVLPSGKSSHLEFGYVLGRARHRVGLIYMPEPQEPELMYLLAGRNTIATSLSDISIWAGEI